MTIISIDDVLMPPARERNTPAVSHNLPSIQSLLWTRRLSKSSVFQSNLFHNLHGPGFAELRRHKESFLSIATPAWKSTNPHLCKEWNVMSEATAAHAVCFNFSLLFISIVQFLPKQTSESAIWKLAIGMRLYIQCEITNPPLESVSYLGFYKKWIYEDVIFHAFYFSSKKCVSSRVWSEPFTFPWKRCSTTF